ncbi:hypothetical protein PanWU01x14_337500 [Parasponia andersonii]|uniref:Uncharacterized protein n=1 Tax=Parasponia andersonii TaxID=3476 RepID=A0A2P5AFJ7_PARAD|nr:hypothetical protein PanWU01x14_337500 [Parasponia andersonii]
MRKHTYTLARELLPPHLTTLENNQFESKTGSLLLCCGLRSTYVDETIQPHHMNSAGIAQNDLEEALAKFAEWGHCTCPLELVEYIMGLNESLLWVIQEIRMLHQQLKF